MSNNTLNRYLRPSVLNEHYTVYLSGYEDEHGPIPVVLRRLSKTKIKEIGESCTQRFPIPSPAKGKVDYKEEKDDILLQNKLLVESLVEPNIRDDYQIFMDYYNVDSKDKVIDHMFSLSQQKQLSTYIAEDAGVTAETKEEEIDLIKN